MITLNNILVATDFGEASEAALRYGPRAREAIRRDAARADGRRERGHCHIRRRDVRGGRTAAAE